MNRLPPLLAVFAIAALVLVGSSIVATSRSGSNGSLAHISPVDAGPSRPSPVHSTRTGAPQNVVHDGSGEHKAGAAGALLRHGLASPATESGAPQPTSVVGSALTGTPNDVTWQGTISYVSASYGPRYLALPLPRGTVARICGPAACLTRTSTDYGPDQRVHPDRIADVSAADFETLSGVPLSFGLFPGSVTIERKGGPQLPPTDQGGTP